MRSFKKKKKKKVLFFWFGNSIDRKCFNYRLSADFKDPVQKRKQHCAFLDQDLSDMPDLIRNGGDLGEGCCRLTVDP